MGRGVPGRAEAGRHDARIGADDQHQERDHEIDACAEVFALPVLRRGAWADFEERLSMTHNLHGTLQTLSTESGVSGRYYSLPALEAAGIGRVSRLPVSIRIVLESVLRNCDGKKVTEEH